MPTKPAQVGPNKNPVSPYAQVVQDPPSGFQSVSRAHSRAGRAWLELPVPTKPAQVGPRKNRITPLSEGRSRPDSHIAKPSEFCGVARSGSETPVADLYSVATGPQKALKEGTKGLPRLIGPESPPNHHTT